MVKKLPRGSTVNYIDELTALKCDSDTLADLKNNYPRLFFDSGLRKEFLQALLKAAGNRKTHGWFWRSYSIPSESTETLKILYDLLLTDHYLTSTLYQFPVSDLNILNLDTHLESDESRGTALELIRFLSLNASFADYTQYIQSKEGKSVVTKFLQDEHDTISNGSSSSSSAKRKREEEEEEDTGITPRKLAKAGKAKWFWAEDGANGQEKWIEYDPQTTLKLEKAFLKNQKTCKVDVDRFVDFQNMLQKRYDDVLKRRNIKREVQDEDDEEEDDLE